MILIVVVVLFLLFVGFFFFFKLVNRKWNWSNGIYQRYY